MLHIRKHIVHYVVRGLIHLVLAVALLQFETARQTHNIRRINQRLDLPQLGQIVSKDPFHRRIKQRIVGVHSCLRNNVLSIRDRRADDLTYTLSSGIHEHVISSVRRPKKGQVVGKQSNISGGRKRCRARVVREQAGEEGFDVVSEERVWIYRRETFSPELMFPSVIIRT